MEHDPDREARIGVGLLFGLAVFALIALASFYLGPPSQLASSARDNIAYSSN